ncbi:MAG: hypothetical protein IKD69_15910 [Solobacterium sp.]|nr:hypothetical protein [Solobacterium sp.]
MEFREMMANARNAAREEGREEGLKEGFRFGDRRRAEITRIKGALKVIKVYERFKAPAEEAVAHGIITEDQLQRCHEFRKWLSEHEGMSVEDYVDQTMDIEGMLKEEMNTDTEQEAH